MNDFGFFARELCFRAEHVKLSAHQVFVRSLMKIVCREIMVRRWYCCVKLRFVLRDES